MTEIFVLEDPESKMLRAYRNFMTDTAVALGANRDGFKEEIKKLFEFEASLHKVSIVDNRAVTVF